jgi:hypothetical protein
MRQERGLKGPSWTPNQQAVDRIFVFVGYPSIYPDVRIGDADETAMITQRWHSIIDRPINRDHRVQPDPCGSCGLPKGGQGANTSADFPVCNIRQRYMRIADCARQSGGYRLPRRLLETGGGSPVPGVACVRKGLRFGR